jgi:hypothetical protein
MRSARGTICLAAAGLMLAVAGCGGEDPAEGLVSNVDKAQTAAAIAALQTSLTTVAAVEAEAPGAPADSLAAALQARDAASRYTTAVPSAAGVVQVSGGGGEPVMLVAVNSDPNAPREPYYIAAWQGDGRTMYYVGRQPPAYSASAPAGAGWSATLPQ